MDWSSDESLRLLRLGRCTYTCAYITHLLFSVCFFTSPAVALDLRGVPLYSMPSMN
ncbi:hypothetical protein BDV98DRAFT_558757 [Pterulicium gracile]|uniref:Uncharacterized protein n=1 Tax=Pterulicium gracile TaxID=1884261 RepID=A0A5C3QVM5_9AGAR|nr:hypothetical protein BDV98DRAFT_558757 [Pterula gracilis]